MKDRLVKLSVFALALLVCVSNVCIFTTEAAAIHARNENANSVVLDKYIEYNESKDQLEVVLTAYAKGEAETVTSTVPTDIVLIVDHSGSMFRPLDSTITVTADEVKANPDKASHYGYYLGKGNSTYVFIFYEDNQWWYCDTFISVSNIWNHAFTIDNFMGTGTGNSNRKPMTEALWKRFDGNGIYQTRYGATYDAMISFVNSIADANESHRIAIVGFGGYDEDATGLYNGSSIIPYNRNTIAATDYQYAFKDATLERDTILASINAIYTGYNQTCTSAGIDMANHIFENNPQTNQNRMVVLLSDGLPSNPHGQHDVYGPDYILNGVIARAYEAKNNHNAMFYSIGALSATDIDAQAVLERASSNYPTATVWNQAEGLDPEGEFYINATSATDLTDKLEQIVSSFSQTSVTANETSYIQDIFSFHFVFPENMSESDIEVMTADYTGQFGANGEPLFSEPYTYPNAVITMDNSCRTFRISGFDYSKEFIVADVPETDHNETSGRMLIVRIPILFADTQINGVYTASNTESECGLYYADESQIAPFPLPHVDVPITVTVSKEVIDNGIAANPYFSFEIAYHSFDKTTYTQTEVEDIPKSFLETGHGRWLKVDANGHDTRKKVSLLGNTYPLNTICVDDVYGGAAFTVTETNIPNGYVLKSVLCNGIPFNNVQDNSVTFPAYEFLNGLDIVFVNERIPIMGTGMMIYKSIAFDGSLEGWKFEIENADGSEIEGSPFSTDETGTILIDNLLPGEYTIREVLPEDSPYYVDSGSEERVITVIDGEITTVEYTNLMAYGSIEVQVTDTTADPLSGATLFFEYSEDGETWLPMFYSENMAKGGCSNADIKDGLLTTDGSGLLIVDHLDPRLHYRVTETACPDLYILMKEPVYDGLLTKEENFKHSLLVVNGAAFELPDTGNIKAFIPVTFGAFASVGASFGFATLKFFEKRKPKQ